MLSLIPILLIVLGFLLLIKGADWMVDGAVALAKKYKVSDLAIGLTIVAFGTSAPELVVNVMASLKNEPDLIFGNVIGSNNFNLFAILGIVGLIFPIVVQSNTVWKEIPISILAIAVVFFLSSNTAHSEASFLSRGDGYILLTLFLLFLFYVFTQLKGENINSTSSTTSYKNYRIFGLIVLGLVGLILGGKMVVTNATVIASNYGLSEKIIGLTIVAMGTSLPELVTSAVAAFKKNSDMAIGNIIGSNIFNILLILPLSALVNPVKYNHAFNQDFYFLAGGTVFLFIAMFTGGKRKLDRWEAGVLLAAFLLYTGYLIWQES